MIVDAHFHCWRLDRADYGWLTPALAPIYRDVSIADWQARALPLGVQAGVLVQAAPTQAETEFLLDQAEADTIWFAVWSAGWICWPPTRRAASGPLPRPGPSLKGLRPMLQDIGDPDWILQPALAPALDAMATAAWCSTP
jgi:L-fuconolactonase